MRRGGGAARHAVVDEGLVVRLGLALGVRIVDPVHCAHLAEPGLRLRRRWARHGKWERVGGESKALFVINVHF